MNTRRALWLAATVLLGVVALVWWVIMGKVGVGIFVALAAGACFLRFRTAGQSAAAPTPVWMRTSVLVSGLVVLISATALIGIVPGISERFADLERLEERLTKIQSTLENIPYDSQGNVPDEHRAEFNSAMSEAKYVPQNINTLRESLTVELVGSGIAALFLLLGLAVILRAFLKPPTASPSGNPLPPTQAVG
jgi:hypothetical protein